MSEAQFLVPDGTGGVTTTICNCARCHDIHKDLTFEPLKGEPVGNGYTHWALCPVTKQPIVLQILDQNQARFAEVAWTPGDIQTIRPKWTEKTCIRFLSIMETKIRDRLTELGWEVLETMAALYEARTK